MTVVYRGGAPWVVIDAPDAAGVLSALADPSTEEQFNQITRGNEEAWQQTRL